MKMYALVLAAGASGRFGAIKQLAEVNGQPLVSIAIDQCRLPEIAQTFVVLGANVAQISPQVPAEIGQLVAPDWSGGMGHSLAFAVAQLPENASHVLITLVDQVAVTQGDIRQLLLASRQAPQQMVAAHYSGAVGVPAIFPRAFFPQLRALSGDRGAKGLLQRHADRVVKIDMPGAAVDIDTPEDLQKIRGEVSR